MGEGITFLSNHYPVMGEVLDYPLMLGQREGVSKDDKKHRVSLEQFVEQYHQLLSTFGIFGALTIFSQSFLVGPIGIFTSFMFLACLFLLEFELLSKFEKEEIASERLWWFQMAFYFAGLAIFCFWLIKLHQYNQEYFYLFLTFICTTTLSKLIGKIFLDRGVYETKLWQRLNTTEFKLFVLVWGPILGAISIGTFITLKFIGPILIDPVIMHLIAT